MHYRRYPGSLVCYLVIAAALAYTTKSVQYINSLYRIVLNPVLSDDYMRAAIEQVDAVSMERCSYICLLETECQALVFNSGNNQCALYNTSMKNVQSANEEILANNLTFLYDESVATYWTSMVASPVATTESTLTTTRVAAASTRASTLFKDCQELFENGLSNTGNYMLDIGKDAENIVHVWCDFDDSHGWTVIQRRQDGSVEFQRSWDDYKHGFGDVAGGECWLGNDIIHELTKTNRKLNVHLETVGGDIFNANYSEWYIGDEQSNYTLTVNTSEELYSGDLPSQFIYHSGMQFTTMDADNDDLGLLNCANLCSGGWWYKDCIFVNLNGRYTNGGASKGINWCCDSPEYETVFMRITRD